MKVNITASADLNMLDVQKLRSVLLYSQPDTPEWTDSVKLSCSCQVITTLLNQDLSDTQSVAVHALTSLFFSSLC